MNYINPPTESPKNTTHKTFFSHILNHEIGYNIYLPSDYWESGGRYPVVYHIHGWQGNESSEIWSIEKVYRKRQAITVFMNAISSENDYFDALLQIGSILIKELIPHIDGQYRTNVTRENRMLSGFSMGGAMAFHYAINI
jgi:enterochelin esterase-like enzyme